MAHDHNVMSPYTWVDILQNINPLSMWWQNALGQVGLVNISYKNSNNPLLEKEIVEEVASYGRQLGRIIEVMEVVLDHTPDESLPEAQQKSIREFREMATQIAAVKAGYMSLSQNNIDRFVAGLHYLKQADNQAYEQAKQQLLAAFAND